MVFIFFKGDVLVISNSVICIVKGKNWEYYVVIEEDIYLFVNSFEDEVGYYCSEKSDI